MSEQSVKTILIVDNDLQVRRAIELILRYSGYHVVMAESGPEGIKKASSLQPDLILMDVMMPEMDGFETIRRIRQLSECDHIPIILLSVLGNQAEARVKGESVGVCDCIAKPVKVDELRDRIDACLKSKPLEPYHTAG